MRKWLPCETVLPRYWEAWTITARSWTCDKMLQVLNPEFAERQRQDAENKALRQELSELKAMMADFFKSSEKASGSNNSKKQ